MRKSYQTKFATAAIFGLIATASFAESHAKSATEKAVDARRAQMQMVGYHIGVLGAVAKGEMAYDSAMVDASAKNLAALAAMQRVTMWIEGTEQGTAEGTRAKAEVWSDPAGFDAGFAALEKASMALVGAADAAAVGAGMGDLGGACKACHEKFRGPKN